MTAPSPQKGRIKVLAVLAVALFASVAVGGALALTTGPHATSSTSSTGSPSTGVSSTSSSSSTCASAPTALDQQLTPTTFDAVTEYNISANRTPAGIAVNQTDDSIWFGEWGLPGIGHLFPNGTLTEYKWPYSTSSYNSVFSACGQITQIWGVALWNGSVWAADNIYDRLVGLNPATGQWETVNVTSGGSPYTLAVGDGDLWFTQDTSPGLIGRLTPNSTSVQYYSLPTGKETETTYIVFRNTTMAYVLTADLINYTAPLYSFNPSVENPTFTLVSNGSTLYEPSGLTMANGGIWATEHAASAMAFLNFTTDQWTIYPTSTVPYVSTVLTYFDASNGTAVWFNEHYANRIGVITDDGRYLTEFSVTNPPLWNITTILENYNLVTMGLMGNQGAWFAAATANIVGFVNASYHPPFSISASTTSVTVAPGQSADVSIQYTDNFPATNLSLQFEDNEFNNGSAKFISFVPGPATTSPSGVSTLVVAISPSSGIAPGDYIAAATVTNGSIYRTVYFTVDVT